MSTLWHRKIPAERKSWAKKPQSGKNPLSKYAPPFILKWKRPALQRLNQHRVNHTSTSSLLALIDEFDVLFIIHLFPRGQEP